MGTDIHLRVQVLRDGAWVDEPSLLDHGTPEDRNYRTFALLADVRNGEGFASSKTHEPVRPWFAGRGLPAGVSPEPTSADPDSCDGWLGEHSFTWATLAELRMVEWDVVFHETGLVELAVYDEWVAGGRVSCPRNWCADSWDAIIVKMAEGELAERRSNGTLDADKRNLVCVSWERKAAADSSFRKWVAALTDDVIGVPPEHVRVLMGFDS